MTEKNEKEFIKLIEEELKEAQCCLKCGTVQRRDPSWEDEVSLLISEGKQLFHLGLYHSMKQRRQRAYDELGGSQPTGVDQFARSRRLRVVRAWHLFMFRRFLRTLLDPIDRLEVYHPAYRPSCRHQRPPKLQDVSRILGELYVHPLGLSRAVYEYFRIWPGILVISRIEIDRAIDTERQRRGREPSLLNAVRDIVGLRSKSQRSPRTTVRPQRPHREG